MGSPFRTVPRALAQQQQQQQHFQQLVQTAIPPLLQRASGLLHSSAPLAGALQAPGSASTTPLCGVPQWPSHSSAPASAATYAIVSGSSTDAESSKPGGGPASALPSPSPFPPAVYVSHGGSAADCTSDASPPYPGISRCSNGSMNSSICASSGMLMASRAPFAAAPFLSRYSCVSAAPPSCSSRSSGGGTPAARQLCVREQCGNAWACDEDEDALCRSGAAVYGCATAAAATAVAAAAAPSPPSSPASARPAALSHVAFPLRCTPHSAASSAGLDRLKGLRGVHTFRRLSMVTASANGRKAFLVDTLALVRRLEAEGLTAKQAEAITHVITEVLHESLDTASHTFVSKPDMHKSEMMAESSLSKLRTEMQGAYDVKLAGLQREVEGLRTDLDKVKSEIRYEVDKVTAGQRLDLNLERGRVKEELNVHAQETSNISNRLDREVNSMKAELEAAKFDVIRYCVGTLVSVTAVGLGILRILL